MYLLCLFYIQKLPCPYWQFEYIIYHEHKNCNKQTIPNEYHIFGHCIKMTCSFVQCFILLEPNNITYNDISFP